MSKEKTLAIIAKASIAFMATVEGNEPRVRPMMFNVVWDGKLYGSTYQNSRKIEQIKKNAATEIVWMDEQRRYIRICGQTSIVSDDAVRKKYFAEKKRSLQDYFSGPEDPNYCLLEIVPKKVELLDAGVKDYIEVKW